MEKRKQIKYLNKTEIKIMLDEMERRLGRKFNKEIQLMRENIAELELIVRRRKNEKEKNSMQT